MARLVRNPTVQTHEFRNEDAFGYQSRPRAGFTWLFVRAVGVDAMIWASLALSVGFWASLLVLAVRHA